jgi:hypothetical protein
MKYPKPILRNGLIICPECEKEYTTKPGYRYHYRKEHQKDVQEKKVNPKDLRSIADLVLKDMPTRERLKPKKPAKKDLKPESWILQDGDWHYGQVVRGVEVGGLAEYNPTIAKERREYLASTLVRLLEYHPNPIKELVIVFQGDMIDGAVLRGNQQSNIEFGVMQQVMDASELLTDYIIFLSGYFQKIRCYGVYGNHARLTPNPKDAHQADNFDMLIYYIVKDRLKGMKNISLEYTQSQHMIIHVNGFNFWCEHGDTVRGWMGIPFYGSQREKANIQSIMSMYREKADYLLMGHHHDSAEFQGIYINGSFVGGDLYSIGKLRRMGPPRQNLLGINEKHGVVWKRQVRVMDELDKKSVKVYR